MAAAQQRWGELHVVYPARSIWNEHPYYILDVPWSDVDHREAARTFLKFLMSEPIQRGALDHGFRPGDPSIPVRFPESPLVKNEKYGLMIEVPTMCSSPKAEVLRNLLGSFLRIEH